MPLVLLRFTTRVVTCFSTSPPLLLSTSFVDEAFWKMGNLESKGEGEGEIGRGREGQTRKKERKKERRRPRPSLSPALSLLIIIPTGTFYYYNLINNKYNKNASFLSSQ